MRNPLTTLPGLLLCAGGLLFLGLHAWQGTLSLADVQGVLALAAGAGLVGAQDGGR